MGLSAYPSRFAFDPALARQRLSGYERRLHPMVPPEPGLPATFLVDLQRPGQSLIPVTDAADPEEEFGVGGGTGIGVLANREVGGFGGDRCRCGGDAVCVVS
jgi:hypothetical protein